MTRPTAIEPGLAPLEYPSELPAYVREIVDRACVDLPGGRVPEGWRHRRRRTTGSCYLAAGVWHREPDVSYTEGIALSGTGLGWVPHAWLTRQDGTIIDLGWRAPGLRYRGIPIPSDVVEQAQDEFLLYGPLLPVALINLGWLPRAAPVENAAEASPPRSELLRGSLGKRNLPQSDSAASSASDFFPESHDEGISND